MAGPEEQYATDAGLLLGTQESGGSSPADETQVQTEHGEMILIFISLSLSLFFSLFHIPAAL